MAWRLKDDVVHFPDHGHRSRARLEPAGSWMTVTRVANVLVPE